MANDANSSSSIALKLTQLRELEQFVAWEDALFSNPHLSGNHKITLRATKRAVQRGQMKDEQGRTRITKNIIAEQTGVSPDTVSRNIKFLEACGVVADHEVKNEVHKETGELKTRTYVSLNEDVLSRPKEITPPEPRKHGGNHYTCQKCGSENVKIRTTRTVVCKCCNHEVELDTTERDLSPQKQVASESHASIAQSEEGTNSIRTPGNPQYGQEAQKQLAFQQDEPFSPRRENGEGSEPLGETPLVCSLENSTFPQKQVASTSNEAFTQSEEGADNVCPPEQASQKQVASTAHTSIGDAPDCSPTRNLRPLLKPDRGGMPATETLPQLAARQNGSSGPRRQYDQNTVPQVASTPHAAIGECEQDERGGLNAFKNQDGVTQTEVIDTSAITNNDGISVNQHQNTGRQVASTPHARLCRPQQNGEEANVLGVCTGYTPLMEAKTQTDARLDPGISPICNAYTGSEHSNFGDPTKVTAAAELLLALAGNQPEHIEMAKTGKAKYYTIKRPLTLTDLEDHLQGGKARGALCSCPDNKTRGLGWDTDEADGWHRLQDAIRSLSENGYIPILEPSPAGRGGHAWIIFDDLVGADAARSHVCSLAPGLATFKEYWPGPAGATHWNKVRLPSGRYARPGVNAWCQLVSVSDGEMATCGQESAALLLAHQTPASIVPDDPRPHGGQPVQDHLVDAANMMAVHPAANFVESNKPIPARREDHIGDAPKMVSQTEQANSNSLPHAEVDPAWQARYDTPEGKRLWFAFTPRFVADWYNERHSVDEMLPNEANGYGLASWRGERTASVKKKGEQWTDFGASARRDDGRPDGGDALELQVRVSQAPKPEVLRQAARELLQEARQELEQAARSGQPIPPWLEEIITPAGRREYARLAEQAGHEERAGDARALADHYANCVSVERDCRQIDDGCTSVPATGNFPVTPVGGLPAFSSSPIDQQSKMLPLGTTSAAGTTDAHEEAVTQNVTTVTPFTEGATFTADARRLPEGAALLKGATAPDTVPQLPNPARGVPPGATNARDAACPNAWVAPKNGAIAPHPQALAVEYDLIEQHHLQHGHACPKCGCELYGNLEGTWHCCRCYPPKGYHQYKTLVDQLYPRRRRL